MSKFLSMIFSPRKNKDTVENGPDEVVDRNHEPQESYKATAHLEDMNICGDRSPTRERPIHGHDAAAPSGHVHFYDTSFKPDQTCFMRVTQVINSVEIVKGSRILIVSQVTAHEYLVFNNEKRIHFVCRAEDISRAPHFDDTDSEPSHDSDHTSDYEREYPEAELRRVEHELAHAAGKPIENPRPLNNVPASTPKPAEGLGSRTKRKIADSTMITKIDVVHDVTY